MKSSGVAELIRKTDLELMMDEFTGRVINKKRTLLGDVWIEAGEITDNLFPALQVYLERKFDGIYSPTKIREALNILAVENQFSQPAELYDSYEKKWDHVKRIDTLGTVFFGNPLADEAIKNMVLYMVAGAYGYTVDWQYTIDFIGRQGTGKTQFLKTLGGQYYTDQITSFRDKDSLEVMAGSLLVNDDEMLVSSGKSAIEFKKFVSSTKLTFRASYGYVSANHKRRFVIARTTNDFGYIKDLTGNRRIVPVIVYEKLQQRHPASITPKEAEQIMGEAVSEFDWDRLKNASRSFDKKIGSTMSETIAELNSDGEFIERVQNYVDMKDEWFTKNDIYMYLTSGDPSLLDANSARFVNRKIVDVLSTLGYREKVQKINGKAKRIIINDDESTEGVDVGSMFEQLERETGSEQ